MESITDVNTWSVLREAKPNIRLTEIWGGSHGMLPGFLASLFMIVISELGDKTFFIAALLAMRHKPRVVFGGAMGALGVMTILSVLAGVALPTFLDRKYTHYASVCLFFVFGVKMAFEAYNMDPDAEADCLAEVEAELSKKDDNSSMKTKSSMMQTSSVPPPPAVTNGSTSWSMSSSNAASLTSPTALEQGGKGIELTDTQTQIIVLSDKSNNKKEVGVVAVSSQTEISLSPDAAVEVPESGKDGFVVMHPSSLRCTALQNDHANHRFVFSWRNSFVLQRLANMPLKFCPSVVFIQAFSLTFLAEWGDRSQIATIALAASKDPFGVTLGALAGHFLCTSLAVIGGRMLAKTISERFITAVGSILFGCFAVIGLVFGV